ncbi:MAG: hypothetical protein WBA57_05035, partial [Elainellaceae cyanobacterium]
MTDDSAKSPTPEHSDEMSPEPNAPETEGSESSTPENQDAEPTTAEPSDRVSEASADASLESPESSEPPAESSEETPEFSEKPEVSAEAEASQDETVSEDTASANDTLTDSEVAQLDDSESLSEVTENAIEADHESPSEAESDPDQPEASKPETSEPETSEPEQPTSPPEPVSAAAPVSSSGTLDKVLAVTKGGTVWTLQNSVSALNWAVLKLEDAKSGSESRETQPSGGEWVERLWVTVQPLLLFVSLTTTRSLNAVLTWSLKKLDADAVPTSTPAVEAEAANTTLLTNLATAIARTLTPILTQLWRLWLRLLAILRDRLLPESLKTLSDITLTTFAAVLLVGILWLTSAITSGGAPVAAQERPDSTPAMTAPPSSSKPVPNSKRLAVLQEKVSALTDEYAEGMVQSVQVNFGGDRLIVTLGSDWYRLDAAQQDQLAQSLLAKTKKLDFSKLDMIDFSGTRIGRSPVVGDDMIIFSRTKDLPPDEPEI